MADKYFRTGGNNANDGSANDDAHAWANPLPGMLGGAQECTSGDVIMTTQAGTFAIGDNILLPPAGVQLLGPSKDTTKITSTRVGTSAVQSYVYNPSLDSHIEGLEIETTASNAVPIGRGYLSTTYNVGPNTPPEGTATNNFPATFTATNCKFTGTTRPVGFEWFADTAENSLDDLPKCRGTFTGCTFVGTRWGSMIVSQYSDTASTRLGMYTGWNGMRMDCIGCTFTITIASAAADMSAVRTTTGTIVLRNCALSISGSPSGSATNTTSGLFAGVYGRIIMFGGSITTSAALGVTQVYDVNVSTRSHNPTGGLIIMIDVDYDGTKINTTNGTSSGIIDITVFPAEADVVDGEPYGANGDDLEGSLDESRFAKSLFPTTSPVVSPTGG